MKFLIAKAEQSQIDACGKKGLFKATNGGLYNYEVDYTEDEMISITDSIGRMVPLDISEVTALAEVLCRIVRFQADKETLQKALTYQLISGANILP